MTELMAERVLGAPPSVVWGIVGDPEHFVSLDPWHHDYTPLGPGRFTLKHSWFPLLYLGRETMTCTILANDAPRRVLYREAPDGDAEHAHMHEQEFLLGKAWRGGTRLQLYVRYTPPIWGRAWLAWQVGRAISRKLAAVERACAQPAVVQTSRLRMG